MQAKTVYLLLLQGIGVYFIECHTHVKHAYLNQNLIAKPTPCFESLVNYETSGQQVTVTSYAP